MCVCVCDHLHKVAEQKTAQVAWQAQTSWPLFFVCRTYSSGCSRSERERDKRTREFNRITLLVDNTNDARRFAELVPLDSSASQFALCVCVDEQDTLAQACAISLLCLCRSDRKKERKKEKSKQKESRQEAQVSWLCGRSSDFDDYIK